MAEQRLKLPTTKTLSIWQPWATLIVMGLKPIENRTWATAHRGKLLIHSGRNTTYFDEDAAWIRDTLGIFVPPKGKLVLGAIIGYVDLIDCVWSETGDGRWGQSGCYHWHLANARSLPEPIYCRGRQRLFNVQL